MKAVRIKQEHYGVIKEMTDRQAGEFVKKDQAGALRRHQGDDGQTGGGVCEKALRPYL